MLQFELVAFLVGYGDKICAVFFAHEIFSFAYLPVLYLVKMKKASPKQRKVSVKFPQKPALSRIDKLESCGIIHKIGAVHNHCTTETDAFFGSASRFSS